MNQILTEDGALISVGDIAYDYYDMQVVQLVSIDADAQPWHCGCPVHSDPNITTQDHWGTWATLDGKGGALLNGARVCSLDWAKKIDYPGASDCNRDAPTGWVVYRGKGREPFYPLKKGA